MATEAPTGNPAGPVAPPRAVAAAALLAPVVIVALVTRLTFASYGDLVRAIDPSSALGPCRDGGGVRPLCDFANHYFPQGRALVGTATAVPGFFYGGFFAVWMRWWAGLDYGSARLLWGAVVGTAALVVLLVPLLPGFRRSLGQTAIYGLCFAIALPVWHDLIFGQVSSLVTALAVLAFVAYGARRSVLAGLVLGLAASIKLYPAVLALHFALRRDRRALLAFAVTILGTSGLLPLLVLGEHGFLVFYASLWRNLRELADFSAANPFANNVANAVSHLLTGHVAPGSPLYLGASLAGVLVAAFHLFLDFRGVRSNRHDPDARTALVLGLAALPFVLRPCWVHYFVFLPLVGGYVLDGAARSGDGVRRSLAAASVLLSAALTSVPLLLAVGGRAYYSAGLPFWATVCLLPGLYQTISRELRRAHGTGELGG